MANQIVIPVIVGFFTNYCWSCHPNVCPIAGCILPDKYCRGLSQSFSRLYEISVLCVIEANLKQILVFISEADTSSENNKLLSQKNGMPADSTLGMPGSRLVR